MSQIIEFPNQCVPTSELPSISKLVTEPMNEMYRPVNMATQIVFALVVITLFSIIRFQPFFTLPNELMEIYPNALIIVSIITLLALIYQFLADPKKRFAVREHDIHYESGLFFRKTLSQPILRIQHVELKRGPIERMFNLASLQVFSAGGATHTFEIPGLAHQQAIELRQFILAHKDTLSHG